MLEAAARVAASPKWVVDAALRIDPDRAPPPLRKLCMQAALVHQAVFAALAEGREVYWIFRAYSSFARTGPDGLVPDPSPLSAEDEAELEWRKEYLHAHGTPPVSSTRPIEDIDPLLGGHMVQVLAYNTERRLYEFQNHWGEQWGLHGRGFISYEAFHHPQVFGEIYTT